MDVRRSPLSGNPSVLVAEPWAGGLVVAVVEAATLSQGLQAAGSRVQVILTDRFGNLVAHPDVHRVLAGDNIADTPLFQGWENRAGRPWSVSRPGGADQVLVQTVAGPGWPLFLLLDQGTLLEPVLRLWAVVLGLFFATGFLVWWWSARQSRLVVDPVARLWTWARSVGQGRYEDPLPRVDIDELEGLNQAFREMVRAVSDRETTIQNWNAELEEKVADRTRLWEEANEELSAMNVELSRTNIELEASFHNLETAQGKLVQAEKKAVYVHLAASLSHELNTPLGAILSSQGSLDHFLERQFPGLLEAYARWTPATRTWFRDLASLALTEGPGVSERDLRRTWLALPGTAVHPLADALAELGVGPSQVVVPPGAEAEEAVHQALWAVRTVRVGRVIQEAGLRASQVLVALEQSLPHEGPSRAPNVSGTGRP
jgi:HAMP domain-containing protein